jgi:hypothetical protein
MVQQVGEPCHLDADRLRRRAAGAGARRARQSGALDRAGGRRREPAGHAAAVSGFKLGTAAMQFVEKQPWIDRFNVNYHLGVDGISVWFVLLTAFITVIVVAAGWEVITERVNQYMGAFLILSGLMVGVFCALDGCCSTCSSRPR